jgi:hypothetical protein
MALITEAAALEGLRLSAGKDKDRDLGMGLMTNTAFESAGWGDGIRSGMGRRRRSLTA